MTRLLSRSPTFTALENRVALLENAGSFVSALKFGALGDGTTDATDSLRRAFASAAEEGACLWLAGTYIISESLEMPANLWVDGPGTIKARTNAAISLNAMLRAHGVDNIRLGSITLDGNGDLRGADYGLWITGGSGHEIDRLRVHDTAQAGIALEEVSAFRVVRPTLLNCGRLLRVDGNTGTDDHGMMVFSTGSIDTFDGEIVSPLVVGAKRKGIATYSVGSGVVRRLSIVSPIVRACGLGGLYLGAVAGSPASQDISVSSPTLDANYVNFQIVNITDCAISNVVSRDAAFAGLDISEGCTNVSVTGYSDTGAGVHSILCSTTSGQNSNITLTGISIRDANASGAAFGAGIVLDNTTLTTLGVDSIVDTVGHMTHGITEGGTSDYNNVSCGNVPTALAETYDINGPHSTLDVMSGGKRGIGKASPTDALDVAGTITQTEAIVTLVNGPNHNVVIPDGVGVCVIVGPTAAFSITGFAGGRPGREVHWINYNGQVCTLRHQDSGSSAGNRLALPSSTDLTIHDLETFNARFSAVANNNWVTR